LSGPGIFVELSAATRQSINIRQYIKACQDGETPFQDGPVLVPGLLPFPINGEPAVKLLVAESDFDLA
jgi:hypothetical protein